MPDDAPDEPPVLDESTFPESDVEFKRDFYTPDREGTRRKNPYSASIFKEINLANFVDEADLLLYLEYQTLIDYSLAWHHQELADFWSAEQQAFVSATRARKMRTGELLLTERAEQQLTYSESGVQQPGQQQQQGGRLQRMLGPRQP